VCFVLGGGGARRYVKSDKWIHYCVQVAKGGEDAYFVSRLHRGVMAVSDGVSGWAEEGIDPADYSR